MLMRDNQRLRKLEDYERKKMELMKQLREQKENESKLLDNIRIKLEKEHSII